MNNQQLPFLFRVVENSATHPVRDYEVPIAVDDGNRRRQRLDARDGVEVDARDDSPQRIEAGNEHPPSHILRGGEGRLKDQRARIRSPRELSRDRAA